MLPIQTRQAILITILGGLIGGVIIYMVKKERSGPSNKSVIDSNGVNVAITAYSKAVEAGEPQENLDDLNLELKQEFGVSVERMPLSGSLIAYDLNGKKIKEVAQ